MRDSNSIYSEHFNLDSIPNDSDRSLDSDL